MLCRCFKGESGLKKTNMHVVSQTAFYFRICKNPAKVFERESKTNNEHKA